MKLRDVTATIIPFVLALASACSDGATSADDGTDRGAPPSGSAGDGDTTQRPVVDADSEKEPSGGDAMVAAVEPASGPTAGGTTITVRGSGLRGVTKVWLGDVEVATIDAPSDTSLTFALPKSPSAFGSVPVSIAIGGAKTETKLSFEYVPSIAGELGLARWRQNNLYESVSLTGRMFKSPIAFAPPVLEQCAPWTLPTKGEPIAFAANIEARAGSTTLLSAPWVAERSRHEVYASDNPTSGKFVQATRYDFAAGAVQIPAAFDMPRAPTMPYAEADGNPTTIPKGKDFVAQFSSALPTAPVAGEYDYNEIRINQVARCYTAKTSSFTVPASVTAMGTTKTLLGAYRHHIKLHSLGDGTFMAVSSDWGKFVTAVF